MSEWLENWAHKPTELAPDTYRRLFFEAYDIVARLEFENTALKRATDRFIRFMYDFYSIRGRVEPLSSDTDEDKELKAILALLEDA